MTWRVAVIGAGPAGEAACRVLAAAGVRVLLIDEQPRPGGNIGRLGRRASESGFEAWLRTQPTVELRLGSYALTVRPGCTVSIVGSSAPTDEPVDAAVIATGAYDLALPIPGLPDPRAATAGALQALLKGQHIVPDGEVVLAGTGPFLYVVASDLVAAGARVTAIADRLPDAAYRRLALSGLPALVNGIEYLRRRHALVRSGTRILRGRHPVAMRHGALELDGGQYLACGQLGISDLFVPQTQLARTAGCALRADPDTALPIVLADEDGRTTVPGIHVAGEGAGIRGWRHARASGALAAAALLGDLGVIAPAIGAERARAARYEAFGRKLAQEMVAALPSSVAPDAVLCGCEGTTVREVEEALAFGLEDLRSLKSVTRLGMGPCQGRYCEPLACRLFAARNLPPRAWLSHTTPTRPVRARDLAGVA